jgi:hypothetical protein
MMTMDDIRANAMKAVSVRSKAQADAILNMEIDYINEARRFRNREFAAAVIGYATATFLTLFCLVM